MVEFHSVTTYKLHFLHMYPCTQRCFHNFISKQNILHFRQHVEDFHGSTLRNQVLGIIINQVSVSSQAAENLKYILAHSDIISRVMSYQHLNKVLIFKSILQPLIFIVIYTLVSPKYCFKFYIFLNQMWSFFGAQTLSTVPEQRAVLLCDCSLSHSPFSTSQLCTPQPSKPYSAACAIQCFLEKGLQLSQLISVALFAAQPHSPRGVYQYSIQIRNYGAWADKKQRKLSALQPVTAYNYTMYFKTTLHISLYMKNKNGS